MDIINELLSGYTRFKVNEDGTEEVLHYPPTNRDLRAANTIKALIDVRNGLERANETLTKELHAKSIYEDK